MVRHCYALELIDEFNRDKICSGFTSNPLVRRSLRVGVLRPVQRLHGAVDTNGATACHRRRG